MDVTESLRDKQCQAEYRARYLGRSGLANQAKLDFETYFDGPALKEHVEGLVEGGFRLSVPDRYVLPNGRLYYRYPKEERYFLGYVNFVLHQVEAPHAKGLYTYAFSSGRRGFVADHLAAKATDECHVLMTDVRKYSESIKTTKFLEVQRRLLADDPRTYGLMENLCAQDTYRDDGMEHVSDAPLLLGTALNAYVNNTMLWEIDDAIRSRVRHYGRFYDDIALVASSREEACECLSLIEDGLADLGLEVNREKTVICDGDTPYCLLGAGIAGQEVSIPKGLWNMLLQMTRPTAKKLVRSVRKGELDGDLAARFELLVLDTACSSRLMRVIEHMFPLVTDVSTARDFDHAMQNWLRAILAGTTSDAKYRIPYDHLRKLGYTSMVNRIYSSRG